MIDDDEIFVRQYRRRKPRQYVHATVLSPQEMAEIEKVREQFETQEVRKLIEIMRENARLAAAKKEAEERRKKEQTEAEALQADLELKKKLRDEADQRLKDTLRAAREGDKEAARKAKDLRRQVRDQNLAFSQAKVALKSAKQEAARAKEDVRKAEIDVRLGLEELKREKMATRLEAVEKKRAIEASKERLRLERMQRKKVRLAEKEAKRKARMRQRRHGKKGRSNRLFPF